MELTLNEKEKYLSIWLTKAESADEALRASLVPIYAEYRSKKYRVVVFCSGNGDLAALTGALLRYNREATVRKELASEADPQCVRRK